jgi:hypothetical protein
MFEEKHAPEIDLPQVWKALQIFCHDFRTFRADQTIAKVETFEIFAVFKHWHKTRHASFSHDVVVNIQYLIYKI